MDDWTTSDLKLPGLRFHPTEEELLEFYLRNMVFGKKLPYSIIGYVNIYHHDPWDLPGLAKIGEREWYFFVPRTHGSGGSPNRTTRKGFWKAIGSDCKISSSDPKKMIGLKKTLVFYQGRAPQGSETDWVMNEYRLPDDTPADTCSPATDSNAVVLCKIYRSATSPMVLEQTAALDQREMQALVHDTYASWGPSSPPLDTVAVCNMGHDPMSFAFTLNDYLALEMEDEELYGIEKKHINSTSTDDNDDDDNHDSLRCKDKSKAYTNHPRLPTRTPPPMGKVKTFAELQVPKLSMEWTEDPFWTQLRSPWLDNYPKLMVELQVPKMRKLTIDWEPLWL